MNDELLSPGWTRALSTTPLRDLSAWEIWGRYGGDMGEIWGKHGGDIGENALERLVRVGVRFTFGVGVGVRAGARVRVRVLR